MFSLNRVIMAAECLIVFHLPSNWLLCSISNYKQLDFLFLSVCSIVFPGKIVNRDLFEHIVIPCRASRTTSSFPGQVSRNSVGQDVLD